MTFPSFQISNTLSVTKLYTFFMRSCCPGFVFPGETHNFWECMLVLSGEVCASADGRVYNLTPGSMICHKPMELHKFYSDSPTGAKFLVISFTASGALTENLKNKVFSLSESEMAIAEQLISYARASAFTKDTGDMLDFIFRPSELYLEIISSYLKLLLVALAGEGQSAKTSDSPEAAVFSAAVSYMNAHLAENPSVSDIARMCNVSQSALKRIFSKYSDCGVHSYFLKLKIKKATSLLSQGKTVTETAYLLGFSDQGYFSRSYLRETGVFPSRVKGSHTGRN